MSRTAVRRIVALVVALALVALLVWALQPAPISVDMAKVETGPMAVSLDEDGVAQIRDVFQVSAPLAGQLDRLPVHVGDQVVANKTVVASIHATDPAFLDVRTRAELQAAVSAAQAAVNLAQAQLGAATVNASTALSDLSRAEQLVKGGTISSSQFENIASKANSATSAVEQARAEVSLRESQLESAKARLVEPGQTGASPSENCCLPVHAPVSGTVIKVIVESAQVVAAGTPLLEIGDPSNMEIVVHLLSTDAVDIKPGMDATIDGWGGPALDARVARVDPAAYTKVSALGIEEQRVDTTLELVTPPAEWHGLGHDFRVVAHIVTWRSDSVVTVPLGALFRNGSVWTVYRVEGGRAVSTPVEIGHRNGAVAEVVKGLATGDTVVLHPSDRVGDGVRVAARQ